MLIRVLRGKLKLWFLFIVTIFLSVFSAYNSINYWLINPESPTRIPKEIAFPWIKSMQVLTFIFLGLSFLFLFLIIKRSKETDES